MPNRSTPRQWLRGPGAVLAAAVMAALVLVAGLPGAAYAWNSYTFSSTAESQMVTLINQLRASRGLRALTVDATLASEARKRSKDMYDRNYFSHDSPDAGTGFDAFDDLKAMGYCYKAAGENISKNDYPDDQTVSVAFNGWKNSSGHLANMVGSYTVIGLGVFKGDGRNGGTDSAAYPDHLYTAIFAYKCASATPTPAPTPRPSATPTPRPTATPKATPRPTATPKATPRPTATPRATPRLTPTPPPTATPSPEVTPELTPEVTPEASQALDPFLGFGTRVVDPRYWTDGSPGSPPADASPDPSSGPVPGGDGSVDGLQVVEPLPDADLLDAIVGGVAGTYFGP